MKKMEIVLLKKIREKNEQTQQELADILKVKRGTYASWECGSDTIPLNKLFLIANYYKTSIDYILGLSKEIERTKFNREINKEYVGKRLKELRQELQLSQTKIASSIGINQSTWWAYENGKTLITTSSLFSLVKKYNYSADWICGRN